MSFTLTSSSEQKNIFEVARSHQGSIIIQCSNDSNSNLKYILTCDVLINKEWSKLDSNKQLRDHLRNKQRVPTLIFKSKSNKSFGNFKINSYVDSYVNNESFMIVDLEKKSHVEFRAEFCLKKPTSKIPPVYRINVHNITDEENITLVNQMYFCTIGRGKTEIIIDDLKNYLSNLFNNKMLTEEHDFKGTIINLLDKLPKYNSYQNVDLIQSMLFRFNEFHLYRIVKKKKIIQIIPYSDTNVVTQVLRNHISNACTVPNKIVKPSKMI